MTFYFFVKGFGAFGTSQGSTGTTGSTAGFGQGASTFGGFGQATPQPVAPVPVQQSGTAVEAVLSSVLYCNVYGDERDAILARWNLLQAAWGTGKGCYLQLKNKK